MRASSSFPSVRKTYRSILFSAALALTLQCCGNGVTRSNADRLLVTLKIPDGESPELFWLGVQAKRVHWDPSKKARRTADWQTGSSIDWDTREGDRIAFEGIDDSGRVVIDGAVEVREEKNVTIPLRRVL